MRSISFSVVAVCLLALCVADDNPCISQSLCHCTTATGEIDLTPLTNVTKVITKKGDEYFLFSPCSSFSQINCKDATVCRDTMSDDGIVVGQADGSKFIKIGNDIAVQYKAGEKTTNVKLVCNEDAIEDMTIEGENPTNTFNLVLTSMYACELPSNQSTSSSPSPSSSSITSTTPKPTGSSTTTPKPTGSSTTTPKPTGSSTSTPKPTGSSTTTPKPTGSSTTPKGGSTTTHHGGSTTTPKGGSTTTPKGGSSTSPKTAPTGSTETTTQGASATSVSFGLIAVIALVCRQFF